MEKTCSKCYRSLPLDDFYNKKNGKYGKHSECKLCICHRVALYSVSHPENFKKNKRKAEKNRRNKMKDFIELAKLEKMKSLNDEGFKNYKKRCSENIKRQARLYLNTAIAIGYIIKPEICQKCHEKKNTIEGHHLDYSDPLSVQWYCHKCHINLFHPKS